MSGWTGVSAHAAVIDLHMRGFWPAWLSVLAHHKCSGLEFLRPPRNEPAHEYANWLLLDAEKCPAGRHCGSPCPRVLALAKAVRMVFGGGGDYGAEIHDLADRFGPMVDPVKLTRSLERRDAWRLAHGWERTGPNSWRRP